MDFHRGSLLYADDPEDAEFSESDLCEDHDSGLGIFEIFINGKKVSDDLFLPLSTDFHERPEKLYRGVPYDEKMRHRLYCPVY